MFRLLEKCHVADLLSQSFYRCRKLSNVFTNEVRARTRTKINRSAIFTRTTFERSLLTDSPALTTASRKCKPLIELNSAQSGDANVNMKVFRVARGRSATSEVKSVSVQRSLSLRKRPGRHVNCGPFLPVSRMMGPIDDRRERNCYTKEGRRSGPRTNSFLGSCDCPGVVELFEN